MTLHLDHLPSNVSDALQRKAAQEGKSLSQAAMEALAMGLGLPSTSPRKRDLSRYRGTWIEDPAVDEALQQFERVDEEF